MSRLAIITSLLLLWGIVFSRVSAHQQEQSSRLKMKAHSNKITQTKVSKL